MSIRITETAYKKSKERLGLKRASVERIATRALMDGINFYETSGQLHKYLAEAIDFLDNEDKFYKIYGENIYLFANSRQFDGSMVITMITVFRVPNELRNQVRGTFKKCIAA